MADRKKKPSRGLLDIIPEPAPEVPDSVQGGWLDAASYDPRMLSYAAGTGLRNMLEGTAALPGLLFDVARGGMQKIRELSPEGQRGSAAPFDTTTVDALSEAARKAAEDPRAVARQVMDYGRGVLSSPGNVVQFLGENVSPRIRARPTVPEKMAQIAEDSPDYRMTHRPMTDEGGASRLHDAYKSFGEDIYGPNALQYFGAGDPREAKVVSALKRLRDNPDAEVTIYRGVPKDAVGDIGKGDWVTLDRSVASEYGDKVLSKKVKAKDITTWPDSLLEFGYYPRD